MKEKPNYELDLTLAELRKPEIAGYLRQFYEVRFENMISRLPQEEQLPYRAEFENIYKKLQL